MATSSDLTVRVLDLLGVTQVGQDPAAEDVEKVQTFVTSVVGILADERVAIIDLTNILPSMFEPLATIVANMAAPAFGQARDRDTIAADKNALRSIQSTFSRRRNMSGAVTS